MNTNIDRDASDSTASGCCRELPIPLDWPEPIGAEVFHGLAGEAVRTVQDHTEADPIAILFQILVLFGNVIGKSAHFMVGATTHYLNLFCVLIGRTAGGRKGTAFDEAKRLFALADPDWMASRVAMGLSTGEGLIYHVRDPLEKQEAIKKAGRIDGYQRVVEDEGVADKRLLVVEPEFASTLKVMSRDGSTLSTAIRQAWDSGDLRTMTKNEPQKATGAHVSMIGHITAEELLRYLSSTEQANGFANRFLWVAARQSKLLPNGGNVSLGALEGIQKRLTVAVQYASKIGRMDFTTEASASWPEIYYDLAQPRHGIVGNLTARAAPQVHRLACLYGLLDSSEKVGLQHLRAAVALWTYSQACVRYVFDGNKAAWDASSIREALEIKSLGMTRTELSTMFGRNKPSEEIEAALALLLSRGLARQERTRATSGRPAERWFAVVS